MKGRRRSFTLLHPGCEDGLDITTHWVFLSKAKTVPSTVCMSCPLGRVLADAHSKSGEQWEFWCCLHTTVGGASAQILRAAAGTAISGCQCWPCPPPQAQQSKRPMPTVHGKIRYAQSRRRRRAAAATVSFAGRPCHHASTHTIARARSVARAAELHSGNISTSPYLRRYVGCA